MSLRLYMDHHVPEAITTGLRSRGIDCVTAADDGASGADDDHVLRRAAELGRVVFTMDDDFLRLASGCWSSGRSFAGIVYDHQLHVTIGQAIRDLELMASVLEPADMQDRVERLPM
jgi:hypothetical protein